MMRIHIPILTGGSEDDQPSSAPAAELEELRLAGDKNFSAPP